LTAIVYLGDYGTVPPDKEDGLSDLLECLVSEKAINELGIKRLKKMGLDLKVIRECLKACRERVNREHIPGAKMKTTKRTTGKRAAPKVDIRAESPAKPVKAPKPDPVPPVAKATMAPPQQWPRIVRMFSREAVEERQMPIQGKAKKRPT
jgi:DNA-binding transcriptional MerR regulator